MRFMILLAIGLLTCTDVLRAEEKPDPRENLDTVIAETIRLIEAKDTETLLKFVLPRLQLERRLEKNTMEELAKEVEPSLPNALKILKQIQGTKPRLSEDEKRAVYEVKDPIDGQKEATFYKEDKFWYLR